MNLKDMYQKKLERKQRIISEYIQEKNSIDGFKTIKREIEFNRLDAEINLLKDFLENLED